MRTLIFGICLLLMSACQKVIKIDLNDTDPRLVIEAWIYDTPGPYEVKLSETTSYFNPELSAGISNAQIVISDDAGQVDTLIYVSPGTFETKHLQGYPGRTYTLKVFYQDKLYEASTYLPPVVPIDSLGYMRAEDSFFGTEGKYLVTFFAHEPQHEQNWYRFNVYKYSLVLNADSLVNARAADWMITDDLVLKGDVIDLPFPQEFDPGDSVTVHMLSLSLPAYEFLFAMHNQIISDGGMFSPPPANPKNNISGGALGYFGASSKASKGVRINP